MRIAAGDPFTSPLIYREDGSVNVVSWTKLERQNIR